MILTVVVGLEEPVAGAFVLLSTLPAFAAVGAIWYAGDPVREPLGPLVVTFLLGTLAAGFARIVNGLADTVFLLGPLVAVFVAPPVEECAKLAAVPGGLPRGLRDRACPLDRRSGSGWRTGVDGRADGGRMSEDHEITIDA